MTSVKLAPTEISPLDIQGRTADLADAEARYLTTLDEPAATEADRIEAAENLERAQALTHELACISPLTATDAEVEAEF